MPILRFRFGSIAQNENAESAEIFGFSINSKDFCQTSLFDTTLILGTCNEYVLEDFLPKQSSFQDSRIK